MAITERNDKGQIVSKELSSQEAAELAKRRWSKPLKEDTNALITEAGYTDTKDCPTDFRLLCERAAGGDVRAILEYMKKTRPADTIDLDVNTCEYFSNCVVFKALSDTWKQGEQKAEITAAKARIQAYRAQAEHRLPGDTAGNEGNGRDE